MYFDFNHPFGYCMDSNFANRTITTFDFSPTDTFLVDTSRYEVIEKPEWKKKMLEQEIETIENKLEHYEGQVEHLLSIESELKAQKKELKKQLKSLDIEAE